MQISFNWLLLYRSQAFLLFTPITKLPDLHFILLFESDGVLTPDLVFATVNASIIFIVFF